MTRMRRSLGPMTTMTHHLNLAAPIDRVRAALTTPEGIAGWWAKDSDVGTGIGARHELRFDKEGRTVTMAFEVTELSDDAVAWRCTDNDNPVWPGTTLRWSLTTAGDRTRVVFEHAGFAEDTSPPYAMTAEGWKHFMASFETYVETGAGQPW